MPLFQRYTTTTTTTTTNNNNNINNKESQSNNNNHDSSSQFAQQQQQQQPQQQRRKSTDGSQTTTATAPLTPLRARSSSDHNHNNNNSISQKQQQQEQQQNNNGVMIGCSRQRLNSRDIPRTYSGLYGTNDDSLLFFELNRHGKVANLWTVLGLYVTVLIVVQLICMIIVAPLSSSSSSSSNHDNEAAANAIELSFTWTNAIHTILSILYIHWMKGSIYDNSGEMDALTLWEQLEATPNSRSIREALMVIPCILCWVACHFTNYEITSSTINVILWMVTMLGKLPFMNGVRLFGINRTAGIDDNDDNIDSVLDPEPIISISSQVLQQQQQRQQQQQQQDVKSSTSTENASPTAESSSTTVQTNDFKRKIQ